MAEQAKCNTCGAYLELAVCSTCGAMDCDACLKSNQHKHVKRAAAAAADPTVTKQAAHAKPEQPASGNAGPSVQANSGQPAQTIGAQPAQTNAAQPPQATAAPAFRGLETMLVQPTPWLGCAAWNMNHFGDEPIDLVGAFKALTAAIDAAEKFRLDDLVEGTFGEINSVAELVFSEDASFFGLNSEVDAARESWTKLAWWCARYARLRSDYVDAIERFRKRWPFKSINDELILRSEYTENPSEPKDAIRHTERTIAARQLRRIVKSYRLFAMAMTTAVADARAVPRALVKAGPKRTPPLAESEIRTLTKEARTALKSHKEVDYAVLTTLHNRLKHFDKTMHKILTSEHVVNLFLHNPWLQVFALNEVNKGIKVLDAEIQTYAGLLRKRWPMPELVVIPGPLIESDSGKGKQFEYYPLVCRKDAKITVKSVRCFDNTGKPTVVAPDKSFLWNKKDKLYRPIVVYDLIVDTVPLSLGTVHTTPAGSEFERVDVWKQLDAPLKALVAEPQPVIICGDYYLTGEAAVVRASDLTETQISRMKDLQAAKTAEGIQLARNVIRVTVQKKLEEMGWIVCQPISGTNWKAENVDEWQKGQIADFFICTKKHFKTQQVGIMRPLGHVVQLDRDDLHNSRYWRLCSDHFPVGGAFSGKTNDENVNAVVRIDGKAEASFKSLQGAFKNGLDPQLMLTVHDFEPEPSGLVPSNPDNPTTARLESKDRKDKKSPNDDDDDD